MQFIRNYILQNFKNEFPYAIVVCTQNDKIIDVYTTNSTGVLSCI